MFLLFHYLFSQILKEIIAKKLNVSEKVFSQSSWRQYVPASARHAFKAVIRGYTVVCSGFDLFTEHSYRAKLRFRCFIY